MSRTYIQNEVAAFLRTTDPYGALSNMHAGFPLRVVDLGVPATENYYQAMRFPHLPDFQAKILAEPHPVKAKRLAYTRSNETRVDWYDVNVSLMRHSLRLRYGHHPEEMSDLFAKTNGMPIVEISSRDNFLGHIKRERHPARRECPRPALDGAAPRGGGSRSHDAVRGRSAQDL